MTVQFTFSTDTQNQSDRIYILRHEMNNSIRYYGKRLDMRDVTFHLVLFVQSKRQMKLDGSRVITWIVK